MHQSPILLKVKNGEVHLPKELRRFQVVNVEGVYCDPELAKELFELPQ